MIKQIKKNKLLAILLIISILTLILSLFLTSTINNTVKKDINKNIINILSNKEEQKALITDKTIINSIFQKISITGIIWILGISIIGIPITILIYITKVILLGWNLFFMIKNSKINNCLFIISYLLPDSITILILFFLTYYSLTYSILLIKLLFRKKHIPISNITKNYIKILIISIILELIITIIEVYLIPFITPLF